MAVAPREKDLGVSIRYYWRDQLLQATRHETPTDVRVGTGARCEFDPVAGPDGAQIQLVSRDGARTFVHVPPSATGSLTGADGVSQPLSEGVFALHAGELARVVLGETRAEISLAAAPPSEREPWRRRIHFSFVVPLALAAAAAVVFVLEADGWKSFAPAEPDPVPPQLLRAAHAVLAPPEKKAEVAPEAPRARSVSKVVSGASVEGLLKATSTLSGGAKGMGYKLSALSGKGAPLAMAGAGFGTGSKGLGSLSGMGGGDGGGIGTLAAGGSGVHGVVGKAAASRVKVRGTLGGFGSYDGGFADVPPAFNPLRAGATDDNTDFGEFVRFLTQWSDRGDTGSADLVDVRDRHFVRVLDTQGKPVPAAAVRIAQRQGQAAVNATTYGDGRTAFYPRALNARGNAAGFTVEASAHGSSATALWDGRSDLTLTLDEPKAPRGAVKLDVLFALDCTGSMGDEMDQIKATLQDVTRRLRGVGQEFDLRYGAVLYRDRGDEFVTLPIPFTRDVASFAATLREVEAGGGGDMPESVNQALHQAVAMPWRSGAAKVVFLVGDAPPHMDYERDPKYGEAMKTALAKGIRIHSVAASGLDALGTLVWRQVAQLTRGKFVFIEYGGSAAATAASHGVGGQFQANNLGDILFDQLRDELLGWGKDAPPPRLAQAAPRGRAHP